MNKLWMLISAGAALGTAGTASAQYPGQYGYGSGYGQGSDWNRPGSYGMFEQQYRHVMDGIRHGVSDGSYTRWQANAFYRELESIRRDAYRSQRYGSYRDNYIQARMARLHQQMHVIHERGHERNDAYGYGYGGYQSGYGGYYDGHSDDGDDEDDNDY